MGNCCSPGKSAMVWAGDDDLDKLSSPAEEEPEKSHQDIIAAASASSFTYSGWNSYPAAAREVKIKITKKELQELVEDANVRGIPVEQGLARFIMNTGNNHHHHQPPWKPTLKSIPE